MTEQRPSNGACAVCETPDGDHLDWCTPQARAVEQRPSKELIRRLIFCSNASEFNGLPKTAAMCREAIAEIERLREENAGLTCDCNDKDITIAELRRDLDKANRNVDFAVWASKGQSTQAVDTKLDRQRVEQAMDWALNHGHKFGDAYVLANYVAHLIRTLRGIQSCSSCEACRGAATLALGGES